MSLRKARRVRLHLLDGNGQPGETVEGIEPRRRPIAGHYLLLAPRLLAAEDQSLSLDGTIEIPAGRVLLRQVLP